ncbi:NAD(P)-binding protein, partial [Martensiomyces pterosporus]
PPRRRVAIVTGANGGIGFETAKAVARAGYTTILACRNLKRGQQALKQLQMATGLFDSFSMMELDLASFQSIDRFVDEFKRDHDRLHLLVCNAGVAFNHYDTTYDGLESQFGTNFVGHYKLISQLLDVMKQSGSARITIASSIAACMVRCLDYTRVTHVWRFNRFINYSTSKLALLVYSNALARRLEGTQVTVNAFHPGLVATGIYRYVAFSTLPGIHDFRNWLWHDQVKGSVTSVYLALGADVQGKTGGYYAREQEAVMHPDALSVEEQERLVKFTEVLI